MEDKKLNEILEKHWKWVMNKYGGERADLSGANLFRADLSGANLSGADLSGANLSRANLYGANLSRADLSGADLSGADLSRADLSGVDLFGADLSGANLSGARIELNLMNKVVPLCCPEHGSFIAWKKAGDNKHIVKIEVTEDAKRSSAYGRKCRCSEARVLAIELLDGSAADVTEVKSGHDGDFIYRVGEVVKVENFDEDRRKECAPGIHFFITRQEAVDY